ncbi:MAG: hypothetical protein WD052_09805 [Bacteroidales bacterium]
MKTSGIGLCLAAGIWFTCPALYSQSTGELTNQIKERITHYFTEKPHDNIYVHTDRSVYFAGEYILFQTTVTDAANLRPSVRSDNSVLVLMDTEGREIVSTTVRISEGQAGGSFKIPEDLRPGNYSLIGYVMKDNQVTANKVYNKLLVILDPGDQLMIDFVFDKDTYTDGDPYKLTINSYGKNGSELKGVNLAYAISTDATLLSKGEGKSSRDGTYTIEGVVPGDSDGLVVIDIHAERRKSEQHMTLQVPQKERVLKEAGGDKGPVKFLVRELTGSQLKMSADYTGSALADETRVVVGLFRKGLLYWSAPGTLKQVREFSVPVSRIPSGILNVVMFAEDGSLLTESMVFYEREDQPEIDLTFDKAVYGRRELVSATVELTGAPAGDDSEVLLTASVVPKEMVPVDELLMDDYMLIDVDLQQDTRVLLAGAEGAEREAVINMMMERYDRNGYSWDYLTGDSDIPGSGEPDVVSGEIAGNRLFPEGFRAARMADFALGITDKRHPDADQLNYKLQLENGVAILDVLRSMKPYTMMGNRIIFSGGTNSIQNQQGALIVIDNTPMGEDASILSTIPPSQVESIFVSSDPGDMHRYTGLNVVGIIEITMKGYTPGSRYDERDSRDQLVSDSYGRYLPGYPDYSLEHDLQSVQSDYRRLLFWKPDLTLNEENLAVLEFYTSDMKGDYVVVIQGMVGVHPVSMIGEFQVR